MYRMLFTEIDDFPLPDAVVTRARQLDIEIVTTGGFDDAELRQAGASCDGVFLLHARVDASMLDAWPQCKVLARIGTGYEKIDVAVARDRGIEVTYVPDFCSEELSDTAMLFMLALARQFAVSTSPGAHGRWRRLREIPIPHRIRGRSLGLIGFGNSAQLLAQKAAPFGLEMRTWTRTPRPDQCQHLGVAQATFDEAISADIVSLHVPSTPQTRGLIDAAAFEKFSDGAWLINIARGEIVDTDAMVQALRSGRLGAAGLDVTYPEPLPDDHPLWQMDNVIITPHFAAISQEAHLTAVMSALEDGAAVLHGRRPRHPVPG